MKTICLKNHLKEAIYLCEKITGKNLSLPILSNILISTEDRNLKLTATNLEIGIEVEIPAKIEKKGKVAVLANIFSSFISNISNEENITLESQNNNLLVSILNSSTLIKGQKPDDFPILPKTNEKREVEIPVEDFIKGLKSVSYAVSFSNIKPEISSVFIYSGKNTPLTFVATDSFRLAEKKFKYSFPDFKGVLVPQRSVSEIMRIFDGRKGKVKLIFDRNQIFVVLDNIKFISRLTEGVFPDYQQIIPKKFTTDVVTDKNLFIGSLKTASVFSNKLNELNMAVNSKNGSVSIKTSNTEAGEHTANIPAKVTGEELKMTFNHKYIYDCLPHIDSEKILLRFSGEGKPLIITGTDDNSFQYIAMPMNMM
ncbi:MAG: DNA polymerase III subunit beta [Candidatus Paceibacterota bacterium]